MKSFIFLLLSLFTISLSAQLIGEYQRPVITSDYFAGPALRLEDFDESNYITLQASSSVSSNYTLTLPAAIGTSGQIMQIDGSGNISFVDLPDPSWGNITGTLSDQTDLQTALDAKANVTLNNLGTTAINANLLPASTSTHNLGSGGAYWSNIYVNAVNGYWMNIPATGDIRAINGTDPNGNSYGMRVYSVYTKDLAIFTDDATGANDAAGLHIGTGDATGTGAGADLNLYTVDPSGTGQRGRIVMDSLSLNLPTFTTASQPTGVAEGDIYYDSSLNSLMGYDGVAWAQMGGGGGAGAGAYINLAAEEDLNWDSEAGDTTNWSETGGGTLASTSTASQVLAGTYAISYDASAASDVLSFDAIDVGELKNNNCIASFWYEGFDENITASISTASGTLNSKALSAQSHYVRDYLTFVCPESPSEVTLSFTASANAAVGYLDNIWIGENYLVGEGKDAATLVASGYIAGTASCQWTTTSTSFAAFSTVAACPAPTVVLDSVYGAMSTTDTDLPQFTVTDLPAGRYVAVIRGGRQSNSGTGNVNCFAVNDGTNTRDSNCATIQSSGYGFMQAEGTFEYTEAGDRTFSLYGQVSAGTGFLFNTTTRDRISFELYRYPLSSYNAFKVDQLAQSWSGYHDNTCLWTRSSTSIGDVTDDASCALVETNNTNFGTVSASGSVSPAITFTPKMTGSYYVCAHVGAGVPSSASNTDISLRLTDGTTVISEQARDIYNGGVVTEMTSVSLCGLYQVDSINSKTLKVQTAASAGTVNLGQVNTVIRSAIEWSIINISSLLPSPLIKQSVVTSSDVVLGHESARITNAGGTASVAWHSGAIASIVDNGTGDVTVNFKPNTFSEIPSCTCTLLSSAYGETCTIDTTTAPTKDLIRFATGTPAAGHLNFDFHFHCHGPR